MEKAEKMENPNITAEEAIMYLVMGQMQIGMLMPLEWIKKNGEDSMYRLAIKKAIYALQQLDEKSPERNCIKQEID
jgi:hypothetical protein